VSLSQATFFLGSSLMAHRSLLMAHCSWLTAHSGQGADYECIVTPRTWPLTPNPLLRNVLRLIGQRSLSET